MTLWLLWIKLLLWLISADYFLDIFVKLMTLKFTVFLNVLVEWLWNNDFLIKRHKNKQS